MIADEQVRFAFGENWARFLRVLNDDRLAEAEKSLQSMLGTTSLQGRTFLDIGSGSGLFSLAAHRLGATARSTAVRLKLEQIQLVSGVQQVNSGWIGLQGA